VRFLLLMFGSMAVEGPALDWASIHIKHHANTDELECLPHSNRKYAGSAGAQAQAGRFGAASGDWRRALNLIAT
jgi:hypothetical protein